MKKYKAICEKSDDTWNMQIVIYENNIEVARSCKHHPQGVKSFVFDGFEFISIGNNDSTCYVRIADGLYFNSEHLDANLTLVEHGYIEDADNVNDGRYEVIYVDLNT